MNPRFPALLLTLAAACLPSPCTLASPLDPPARESTVAAVNRALTDRYVFPEVARRMTELLQANLASGAYDSLSDGERFASRLTSDLRSVSHDKHLRVRYSREPLDAGRRHDEPTPEESARFRERQRRENAGFVKAEVLPGNLGYLSLRYFGIAEVAGPRIAGAMQFLAGTDAMIVDLRDNGGAIDPGSIAILCSYFLPEGRVHLNSLYWRDGDRTEQSWSLPSLPGPRYLERPVYVLTSPRTFSGAEECAYNLQTQKRATLVGEVTGGGANPGWEMPVTDHFLIWVPNGRAINPVTGTNWEGTGVKPEVPTRASRALLTARKLALEFILTRASTEPEWQEFLRQELGQVEKELAVPERLVQWRLNGHADARRVSLVGSFNGWNPEATPMKRQSDVWLTEVSLDPGDHAYKFWVDGEWLLDPGNPLTATDGPHTNSMIRIVRN